MPDDAAAELRSPAPDAHAVTPDQAPSPDARRLPGPADIAPATPNTATPSEAAPAEPGEPARTDRGRHSLDQPESAATTIDDATPTPPPLPEPPALPDPTTGAAVPSPDDAARGIVHTSPTPGDAVASAQTSSAAQADGILTGDISSGSTSTTHATAPAEDVAADSAPADRTTRMSLPADLAGGAGASAAGAPDARSAYSTGGFTPSAGTGSSYRPGESVAPQQAPGPDQHSHYVSQTPTYHSSQYKAIPGDPSPGAGTHSAPDARTETYRSDDPRVQAARNQAPGGDYAPPAWQAAAEQQPYAPQTGYRSGEFAQPANPISPYQQTPGQYQPGEPAHQLPDGTVTPQYPQPESYNAPAQHFPQPDGAPAQHQRPDVAQAPHSEATRHYQQPDAAQAQPNQRPDGAAPQFLPDGSPAPQYQPDGSPTPQFLPDGTPAPNFQRPDGAQPYQQPGDVAPQQFQGGQTVPPYQQQAPGPYQQPGQYQQPTWGANPQHGYQPPSLDNVPVKRVKKAPGSGWRKAVHHVSGGAINPGMSAEERRLQELVARIRQPVRGDYRIAVLSLKGGVGKTTTTTGLGSIFASIRGDRVIAVDANPDFGTLSQRVALQTRSTVRDLLLDPSIERYSDVRRHTSQSSSRLEVLASERDPAASESFNDEEYRAVARILQRFYNIILTDCGTGLMHSAMSGVLDLAHSLVLISSAAIDGARSAAATLDWLSLHGHDHLVRNAVVVINLPREGSPNVGVQQLREYFLSRCRAVHIIPFDEHLSEGAEIDLHRLHKTTKRAYVELAATVADEFGVDHHRFG
ncbi:nucleotide-binding protein [Nocardia sp. MW-W600-9]